jgi:hypothetical protein
VDEEGQHSDRRHWLGRGEFNVICGVLILDFFCHGGVEIKIQVC